MNCIRLLMFILLLGSLNAEAQHDTLRIMSYNVLGYGDGCQGEVSALHNYLNKIVTYANPDILGLVKTASVKSSPNDIYGIAPYGFADSVITQALNPSFPGRFKYCPFTNTAYSDKISILFYNQEKLGYLSTTLITSYITDFDLYKLYYKDINLDATKDTTFLYVLLNHTQSGTDPGQRNTQIQGELAGLYARFYHLPNLINMGDFNTRSSLEAGYYSLTQSGADSFRFIDPPFGADSTYSYPANWNAGAGDYAACLTTSTRALPDVPNTCGTDGGAKAWYDHILLSPWIWKGENYLHYIPGSYQTIGNDGHRLGIAVNDSTLTVNTAAPPEVIDALFQFSNKYPVLLSLEVMPNTTGVSLPDPDADTPTGIDGNIHAKGLIRAVNPIRKGLSVFIPEDYTGRQLLFVVTNLSGQKISERKIKVNELMLTLPFDGGAGVYFLSVYDTARHGVLYRSKLVKL